MSSHKGKQTPNTRTRKGKAPPSKSKGDNTISINMAMANGPDGKPLMLGIFSTPTPDLPNERYTSIVENLGVVKGFPRIKNGADVLKKRPDAPSQPTSSATAQRRIAELTPGPSDKLMDIGHHVCMVRTMLAGNMTDFSNCSCLNVTLDEVDTYVFNKLGVKTEWHQHPYDDRLLYAKLALHENAKFSPDGYNVFYILPDQ